MSYWSRFQYYQNKYMVDRLGKDWATNNTISADGFVEQTAFLSIGYGLVRALFSKGYASANKDDGNQTVVKVNPTPVKVASISLPKAGIINNNNVNLINQPPNRILGTQ